MTTANIHTYFYLSGTTTAITELMSVGEAVRNVRDGVSVLLVSEGEARIRIDDGIYRLSHGSIVVLFPCHLLACEWKSDDFLFEYLYFDFDFMADFPLMLPPEISEQFGATPYFQVDEKRFSEMTRCYEILLKYNLMNEHPSRIGIVKAQLFTFISELLYHCTKSAKSVRVSREEVLTEGFFQLLHRHYKTERTLMFYAEGLCITTKHLSKVIRRTTGQTAYFWIEEFLVKEAKFFRRHTGCSPIEFRRN